MSKNLMTTLVLLALAMVVGGASYYVTDVVQGGEVHKLEESRRVAHLMTARVEELIEQESVSAEAADAALSRWHARYKYIPRELNTADIVEYLEGLTRSGFEQFDLKLGGQQGGADFSTYQFQIEGLGTYAAVYHLVWHLENNREFYRMDDVRMEHLNVIKPTPRGETQQDMVKFSFGLTVYYAGLEGISAPQDSLRPIPVGLLAAHNAERDIFRPLVRVPREVAAASGAEGGGAAPGAAGGAPGAPAPAAEPTGLDVEQARLVMVLGNRAFFDDARGRHIVQAGDRVNYGTIEAVDASTGAVRAVVTRDGQRRVVVRTVDDGGARPPGPGGGPR